ncbi:MAG: glycosyltransferase family 4 protein [Oscillatoriales cyanobacterium RM2_1_1]|nr:glycosyltransferase family 4 protein [Oscillatoriales cyanobacterium SM2_3_0]NJO44316.1 glycosyltransferase family 4 protein [Oscillatoriales cyanobacterium RM2_1_1]
MISQAQGSLNEAYVDPQVKHSRDLCWYAKPLREDSLRVLFLAPHPFYQDRGTPINSSIFLKALSEEQYQVDVLTYPEGQDVQYPNVTIYRTLKCPLVSNVKPGFSWKKLIYDVLMLVKAIQLVSRKQYDVIQGIEESVFIALLFKLLLNIPYVYDMDSSIAQQMVEQLPWLSPLAPALNWFEKLAVKRAKAVIPVCDAIAQDIAKYSPERVMILPDISLLAENEGIEVQEDLRADLGITGVMLMYVGNLEGYQGIDLMIEGFAIALQQDESLNLVIIGGDAEGIETYRQKAAQLGAGNRVHFMGQRPATHLSGYLSQADILVSPRTKGKNTPMKIYSYLDSGKAVLATDLLTHTQVLTDQVALLAKSDSTSFAAGMVQLAQNQLLCQELGLAGRQLVAEKHSYSAFRNTIKDLYGWLKSELLPQQCQAK